MSSSTFTDVQVLQRISEPRLSYITRILETHDFEVSSTLKAHKEVASRTGELQDVYLWQCATYVGRYYFAIIILCFFGIFCSVVSTVFPDPVHEQIDRWHIGIVFLLLLIFLTFIQARVKLPKLPLSRRAKNHISKFVQSEEGLQIVEILRVHLPSNEWQIAEINNSGKIYLFVSSGLSIDYLLGAHSSTSPFHADELIWIKGKNYR